MNEHHHEHKNIREFFVRFFMTSDKLLRSFNKKNELEMNKTKEMLRKKFCLSSREESLSFTDTCLM